MAVYTEVSQDELVSFLADYDLGEALALKGIAEGVENSNYLLRTTQGPFILTLYEKRVDVHDLPFFVDLLEHLAATGLPCPTPIRGRDGTALRKLCGRPASIVSFLNGLGPRRIEAVHCAGVGQALARLHAAGTSFPLSRINTLGIAGWRPLLNSCGERADEVLAGLSAELRQELDTIERTWPRDLPAGIIHADLFPDNVFFQGEALSGLIDFYFACTDFLAYDLAICLNAWCFELDGSFNITKARAMLGAYEGVRTLDPAEREALPLLARGSALRFLLTRLYDWLNHPAGAFVKRKDPLEYLRKLRFHQQVSSPGGYGI